MRPLGALAVVAIFGVTACTDDGEAGDTGSPAAAAESAPDPTTLPASDVTVPTTVIPTTVIPGADETAPETVTTASTSPPDAGPLEVPEVQLIQVGSFDTPIDMAWRFVDPRFFVVEQGGRIVAFDDESSVPVLDIADVDGVGFTSGGERGLLGLAFHPDLDLAYVNFTDGDGNTVVAEFAIDPTTAEFDPSSYREVLMVDQPFSNHNGGDLAFGPDGYLYIATGDGGSGGDPERTALDLTNRLGKLLRIDPTPSADGRPFTVPDDNPFLGADDADPTIWSYGLRNPWKFSFDPATNDLWIGDVGQNGYEEIDLAPSIDGADAGRGLSFGWSAFEGDERFNDDQSPDGHVPPVLTYAHGDAGCSVSAGTVARESSYPDLDGWYVFGDFCSGRIWALDTTSVTISDSRVVGEPIVIEIANLPGLVAVRTGPDGDVYAVSIGGQMFRVVEG